MSESVERQNVSLGAAESVDISSVQTFKYVGNQIIGVIDQYSKLTRNALTLGTPYFPPHW